MKILYLVESRETIGGGVRATRNLIQKLSEIDKGLELAYFGPTKDLSEGFLNITKFSNDNIKPVSTNFFSKLKKAISNFTPDIVHAMGLYTGLLSQVIRNSKRSFSLVVTVHRTTYKPRLYPFSKIPAKWLASRVDHATFLTEYQKKHYSEVISFAPKKKSIIPNVIPRKLIDFSLVKSLRDELVNRTKSKYLMIYAGRLIPSKQIGMILDILSVLRQEYPVGAIIVGNGPKSYKNDLLERVKKLGIQNNVLFTGFKDDPENYIAASDIAIFPTQHEALPNLLIESYMLGKPVVTSNIEPLKCLTENSENSLVSKIHDAKEYAKLVEKLINNEDLYKYISNNAKREYLLNYKPSEVAKKYLQVYNKSCFSEMMIT